MLRSFPIFGVITRIKTRLHKCNQYAYNGQGYPNCLRRPLKPVCGKITPVTLDGVCAEIDQR